MLRVRTPVISASLHPLQDTLRRPRQRLLEPSADRLIASESERTFTRIGPANSVNSYLYDKYFYGKRAVNPTMSLNRRSSASSYYQYVRPEQERREAFQQAGRQYVQQRKLQGNVGHTNYGFAQQLSEGVPSASAIPRSSAPMPYYNQWCGSKRL